MTEEKLISAITEIDPDILDQYFIMKSALTGKKKPQKSTRIKWTSLVACFVILIVGVTVFSLLSGDDVTPGVTDDRYKGNIIQVGELGVVFPWEYMTTAEKYVYLDVSGEKFVARQREISESYIGNKIGSFKATGFDNTVDDGIYTETFEVYEIKGISSDELVAAKIEGKYFVFISDEYNPPATFGQVMENYNISEYIELNRFSFKGDDVKENYHLINDDEYVWNVLKGCADAPYYADEMAWHESKGNYISFTVTSEALGVYKRALYVTENGYVWTNVFDGAFIYDIGTEAAASIINYAKENSTETTYEPYHNAIYGKIVEITDEYVLVDDSILCKDPADGITFKVQLNDLRISRYIDCGIIKVGETVQISFEGEIKNNTVDSAIAVAKIIVSGEQVLIPE